MSVKQTSWQAYQDILRGGVATKQAEVVLQAINYHPGGITRAEIAKLYEIPINSVCGRVNQLLASDVIYIDGTRKCTVTGRNVEKLKVVNYD